MKIRGQILEGKHEGQSTCEFCFSTRNGTCSTIQLAAPIARELADEEKEKEDNPDDMNGGNAPAVNLEPKEWGSHRIANPNQ